MSAFFRRLYFLLNRRRLESELASDMDFHREMSSRQGGVPFGNTLQLREEAREAWGWTWLDSLSQDLRYATRMLRRSPGFALAAVLMLAFGIGVNVAAFGLFNVMLLRPIPVREPETLLRFEHRSEGRYAYSLPYSEVAFFREHSRTLSAVLAVTGARLSVRREESPINASFVTSNFFTELGGTAIQGQLLNPSRDDLPYSTPVVILSHGFWHRRFADNPAAVGTTIRLNERPATVIGVASPAFTGLSLDSPDVWVPIVHQPYFVFGSKLLVDYSSESEGVRMFGRRKPAFAPQAVEEEMRSLAAELHSRHPVDLWDKETFRSLPGGYARSLLMGDRRGTGTEPPDPFYPAIALMSALALLILAVACSNLGGLLLARGVARQREIAIRVSVGAGAARLLRQFLTESLLLATLGSIAGLFLGHLVLRAVMVWTGGPAWIPATLTGAPDWRVAAFALCIGFAAAILFGLMPALQLVRRRFNAPARTGSTLARQVLICAQVAGSCVLLIVAGLLVRALHGVVSTNPGFEFQQVVAIDPRLSSHGYSPAQARDYLDRLESRVRALPGVVSVSITDSPPLGNRRAVASADISGRSVGVQINRVDPEFFETMKIPLLRGRNLLRGDSNVVIVNQSIARQWPTGDPLGRTFNVAGDYTVVGIAGSARIVSMEDSDAVEVYLPVQNSDLPSMVLMARTIASPEALAKSAAAVARSIDPGISPEVQTLKSSFGRKLKSVESSALAVTVLGLLALMLACLGIVGLVAYAVSQRTKEIGIRMALGARPSHVLAIVLRQFSRPVIIGLVLGTGTAAALSKVLRQTLYGISNLDPTAYVTAIAVFIVTVAVAAIVPARRALRVDPMLALRQD